MTTSGTSCFRMSQQRETNSFYALGCAMFDSQCYGATVEEIEQDQDEEDIEDFVAFSIKSLGGCRRWVSVWAGSNPRPAKLKPPKFF